MFGLSSLYGKTNSKMKLSVGQCMSALLCKFDCRVVNCKCVAADAALALRRSVSCASREQDVLVVKRPLRSAA